jgi:hypothetical protein
MVTPVPRLDRSVKRMLYDAPVSLNESNDFALSVGVMLDVFGGGPEACVLESAPPQPYMAADA